MTDDRHERDWGSSLRTILQLLIVMGVGWLALSVNSILISNASTQQQIKDMGQQITDLRAELTDIPTLRDRVTALELHQGELLEWKARSDTFNAGYPSERLQR